MATAKMALLLEMGLSSFGGGANKVDLSIERYLPFNLLLKDDRVSQETADIFWDCVGDGLVPAYVERAIASDKSLMDSLKAKKRG